MHYLISNRIVLKASVLLLSVFVSGTCVLAQSSAPLTLDIQVDKPLHKVSPMLYGLMTEEINFSYDGGLYAEMIRNRTFGTRSHAQPVHWYLVEKGQGSGSMGIDESTGPSDALPSSLRIDITKADATSPVGVYNDGYWGMALTPGRR